MFPPLCIGRTTASIPAFQAGDAGSIPVRCSSRVSDHFSSSFLFLLTHIPGDWRYRGRHNRPQSAFLFSSLSAQHEIGTDGELLSSRWPSMQVVKMQSQWAGQRVSDTPKRQKQAAAVIFCCIIWANGPSACFHGRLAQLGEHLLCKQGGAGSSPAPSTTQQIPSSRTPVEPDVRCAQRPVTRTWCHAFLTKRVCCNQRLGKGHASFASSQNRIAGVVTGNLQERMVGVMYRNRGKPYMGSSMKYMK